MISGDGVGANHTTGKPTLESRCAECELGVRGLCPQGTALLSDNGPGYRPRQLAEYLRLVSIRHLVASPYRPETNGKMERHHRGLKGEVGLVSDGVASELEAAIKSCVHYYNYHRYREGLGNITRSSACTGRYVGMAQQREKVKIRTLRARKDYRAMSGSRTAASRVCPDSR
ncbi:MAG: integrase core domain-containing protein, partial [Chloroflexi bacterium]|nr:integrase core domain-containing protein [Chloroflexota bacterium]